MKLEQALEDFLLAARADGLAPATLAWYGSTVGAFVRAHPGRRADSITARDCRQYIAGLYEQDSRYVGATQKPEQAGGLSPASIAGHVRALHRFFAWCSAEYRFTNPMSGIRKPKQQRTVPAGIEARDFVRLWEDAAARPLAVRNCAILAFLADTGCRLQGIAELEHRRVDLERRRAVVIEKGQRPRAVSYTHYTASLLARWIAIRGDGPGRLFGLTGSGIYQVIKRLKQRTGVRGRVSPKAFRHGFARAYLLNGGNLVTLSRALGHRDIGTTAAFYAVFTADEIAELNDRYSPLLSMLATK